MRKQLMNEDKKKTGRSEVGDAWERATKLFANAKALRPRMSWLTGVSMDTGADRLQCLLRQSRTSLLHDILDELDDAALSHFVQRTEINLERAAAALRLNLVVNISAPVGALVIVNQLFPEFVSDFVADYGMDAVTMASFSVVSLVLLSIWYSYCCVTQARDLAHLTRLYAVRQGEITSALHDFDDEPLNPAELA